MPVVVAIRFLSDQILECDRKLEAALKALEIGKGHDVQRLPKVRTKRRQVNAPDFEVRSALYRVLGVDLTQIHGMARRSRSNLSVSVAPISRLGPAQSILRHGYVLRRATRYPAASCYHRKRVDHRAVRQHSCVLQLPPLAEVTPRFGAFYRRLSARAGKAKAVTATARKIAVLFYNSLRHGMAYQDPGATQYEERYRNRVIGNLQRRAKVFGFALHELPKEPDMSVS